MIWHIPTIDQLNGAESLSVDGKDIEVMYMTYLDNGEQVTKEIWSKLNGMIQLIYLDEDGNRKSALFTPQEFREKLIDYDKTTHPPTVDLNAYNTMYSSGHRYLTRPIADVLGSESIEAGNRLIAFIDRAGAITNIADSAFSNLENLEKASLPYVKSASTHIFNHDYKLHYVNLSAATTIQAGSFEECNAIKEIYVNNDTIKTIDDGYGVKAVIIQWTQNSSDKQWYWNINTSIPLMTRVSSDIIEGIGGWSLQGTNKNLHSMILPNLRYVQGTSFQTVSNLDYVYVNNEKIMSIEDPDGKLDVLVSPDKKYLYTITPTCKHLDLPELTGYLNDWNCGCNVETMSVNNEYFNMYFDGRLVLDSLSTKIVFCPAMPQEFEDFINERGPTLSVIEPYTFRSSTIKDLWENNTDINLPHIQRIGTQAFYGIASSKVNALSLDNCTSIDNQAFGKADIHEISIPKLSVITSACFQTDAKAGTQLAIKNGDNIQEIGQNGFQNRNLPFIKFENVKTIGKSAFQATDSSNFPNGMKYAYIPKAATIGDSAFSGCNSLSSVNLSAITSLDKIANDLFTTCPVKECFLNSMTVEMAKKRASSIGLGKKETCICYCSDGEFSI